MCLYVGSGPHVATEDIKVIKVLFNDDRSKAYSFHYVPNQEYFKLTPFELNPAQPSQWPPLDADWEINEGFHSFNIDAISAVVSHQTPENRGWYTLNLPGDKEAVNQKYFKIVFFYIPKGATYYIGSRGDLVSNRIRSGSLKAVRPRDLRKFIKKVAA